MPIRFLHPGEVNLETDNSSFSKCPRQKLEIVGPRGLLMVTPLLEDKGDH